MHEADLSVAKTHENQMTDQEFLLISSFVYEKFGIVLGPEKRALAVGRLQGCLNRRKISSYSEYLRLVKKDQSGEMLSELVNQISTNFTAFFREPSHFEFFSEQALPEIISHLQSKRQRDLRIWCAACSSGEEAYTIQITMMRKLGISYREWDAGLLATDISEKVLSIARSGIYSTEQIHNISSDIMKAYFKETAGDRFEIKPQVKREILFRRFNLMNRTLPFRRPFHTIFCRNVMIYFNEETRRDLVDRLFDQLETGGYLIVGLSESIQSARHRFETVIPSVFRKLSA